MGRLGTKKRGNFLLLIGVGERSRWGEKDPGMVSKSTKKDHKDRRGGQVVRPGEKYITVKVKKGGHSASRRRSPAVMSEKSGKKAGAIKTC